MTERTAATYDALLDALDDPRVVSIRTLIYEERRTGWRGLLDRLLRRKPRAVYFAPEGEYDAAKFTAVVSAGGLITFDRPPARGQSFNPGEWIEWEEDEWEVGERGMIPTEAIGRKIATVELDEDKEVLTLALSDGTLIGRAEGDCCSHSWVEHLTVPPDVAGATIQGYSESDEVEENRGEEYSDSELTQVYHSAIQTDRGEIIIEYRNESNGYYGGWMSWRLA